jgi:hypothetical protein
MRLLRVLIVLAVLAVAGLYVADRIAAHAAADRIATAVQSDAKLADRPRVSVKGFPFLTQALKGRYDRIEVTATDLFKRGDPQGGATFRLEFAGVHIPASEAISGKVRRIPVDRVTGTVAVPFGDLQAAAHVPGLTALSAVPGGPDQVAVSETASIAGVALAVRLTARVTVGGGSVVVTAQTITAADGSPVPAAVAKEALARAAFSVKLPGLPVGVRLTGVSVTPTGVLVAVGASQLVVTR